MEPTVSLAIEPTQYVVSIDYPDGRHEAYAHLREDCGPTTYTSEGDVPTSELQRSVSLTYDSVDEILIRSVWTRADRLVKDSRWVISKRASVEAHAVIAALA